MHMCDMHIEVPFNVAHVGSRTLEVYVLMNSLRCYFQYLQLMYVSAY